MIGISLFLLTCIPKEEPIFVLNLSYVQELPALLQENSGMIEAGNLIWFHNDGGNEPGPVLYGYSLQEESIVRTVMINGASNIDWEDITQYGDNIYIGDFGNNEAGNRTDLRIYVISRNDLLTDAGALDVTDTIAFSYSDQTVFTPQEENSTAFDCEGFIATADSLYLFAKDWQNQKTRIYSLSVRPGQQIAKLRKQWNVSGLITSAAWSPEKQELYLLGYTPYVPFVWIYSGFSPDDLSYLTAKRTDFNEFLGAQTEGIMVAGNGTVYVSNESSSLFNAYLFSIVEEIY